MDGFTEGAGRPSANKPMCCTPLPPSRLLRFLVGDGALGRFLVQELQSAHAGCRHCWDSRAGLYRYVVVNESITLPRSSMKRVEAFPCGEASQRRTLHIQRHARECWAFWVPAEVMGAAAGLVKTPWPPCSVRGLPGTSPSPFLHSPFSAASPCHRQYLRFNKLTSQQQAPSDSGAHASSM